MTATVFEILKTKRPDLAEEMERRVGTMVTEKLSRSVIIDRLAKLEHEQWMEWSKALVEAGEVGPETIERWAPKWIPYEDLPEKEKNKDRVWAQYVYKEVIEDLVSQVKIVLQAWADKKAELMAADIPDFRMKKKVAQAEGEIVALLDRLDNITS